ncbi:MAG: hypothetical protein WBB85_00160, partial [Albidovulum sp.]
TNSAYSVVDHSLSAGGARVRGTDYADTTRLNIEPADYTAEGAVWSGKKPKYSAVTEEGSAMPGLLAAGTYSESTARFSGTSAAAATVSRELILEALGIPEHERLPTFTVIDETQKRRLGDKVFLQTPANRSHRSG